MTERGPVVSNTGPIIALAVVGRLDLLAKLYGRLLVPDAVWRETVIQGESLPGSRELRAADWVERVQLERPPDSLLSEDFGAGEAEAITLASRRGASLLLIDDLRARRVAVLAYGLRVRGVVGTVVSARRHELVSAVGPLLRAIRESGYYIADWLIDFACREVGET
ncbi:MAG: DUF3368 domain-containing protein [Planctomycetes bacterium]|nr:DUF3368 domain-containing protein [Planctomycetota bacterium]